MVGDSKYYNDKGELIAWRRGVTFVASDKPYALPKHEYVFSWHGETIEEDENNFEVIRATDALTAFRFFVEQYNVGCMRRLSMQLKTVTYTDVDYSQFEF